MVLGALLFQLRFQPLDVFGSDRIKPLVAQRWLEVHPQDHFFGVNPTRLLLVGLCMALEKARREFHECGHLLFRLNCALWMGELMEPLALAGITPPLGGGLR
jgi:hypothetical protein